MAQSAYRKTAEEIRKRERDMKALDEMNKCDCVHNVKGNATLAKKTIQLEKEVPDPDNPGKTIKVSAGERKSYICDQCTKPVNIKPHTLQEIEESLTVVDDMIDVIKLNLTDSEEDQKARKRLAKTQYRVRNELMAMYKAAIKRNNGGKNRNNRNNGNNGGGLGKPNIV